MRTDVIILTASFGNGHNAATQGLIDHIESLFPEMTVKAIDLFSITAPKFKSALEETYRTLTKHGTPLYNAIYTIRNHQQNLLDALWLKLGYAKFQSALVQYQPRMIVSVFPTCAQFAARYKKDFSDVKTITILTDVVDSWEWIHPMTDMYCVPADCVREKLAAKGIDPHRIFVTGIPVKKGFFKGNTSMPTSIKPYSYSNKQKRVLIMGSAMGKLSFNAKTIHTLGLMPYHFTIVTGQDVNMHTKLSEMLLPDNFTLIGFTDQVPLLMKQADLIITKPGGATIFEAIESNLPILVQPSNVGQETGNRDFVERYGFGDSFLDAVEMIRKIESLLADDTYSAAIKRNMQAYKLQSEWSEVFSTFNQWQGKDH